MSSVALLACEAPYDERTANVAGAIKNCPQPPCGDPDPTPNDPAPQPQLSAAKISGGIELKWSNVPSNLPRTLWRQLSIAWDCRQATPGPDARVALTTIPAGSTQTSFADTTPDDLKSPSRYFYFLTWPSESGSKEINAVIDLGKHPGIDFQAIAEDWSIPDFTTERRVQFEWTDNLIAEQQYVVERRIGPPESTIYKEVFKTPAEHNATCRKYVGYEYDVKAGEAHCYRLKVLSHSGGVSYSSLDCVVLSDAGCPDNPGASMLQFPFCADCFGEPFERRTVVQSACYSGAAWLMLTDQFPGCGLSFGACN